MSRNGLTARGVAPVTIIEFLWLQIGPYHNLMFEDDAYVLGDYCHEALVESMRRRDGPAARQATEDDLDMFAECIRPRLVAQI